MNNRKLKSEVIKQFRKAIQIDDMTGKKPGPNGTTIDGYIAYLKLGVQGRFINREQAEQQLIPTLEHAIDDLFETPIVTDDDIRAMWVNAGGTFHGTTVTFKDDVDSYIMTEERIIKFIRGLL